MGNVTLTSTDPQEVVARVLQVPEPKEETFGEVASDDSAETAAESQTAVESTEEEHGEESEHKPSKRSQKVKRLAEKLTAAESRAAAAERERDELRQKYETRREEQPKASESPKFPPYPVPKPKADDFRDPMDHVEAVAQWASDKRDYERSQQAEATKTQTAQQEAMEAHYERVEEAREKYDDWDEVIDSAPPVAFKHGDIAKGAFYAAISESEDGADVMYYLGKHPEVAEEFFELTPAQVAAKVGRIAAKLPSQDSPKREERTALRRINPVGGGSKRPDVPNDRSNMPHSEWKKLRKQGLIR